MAPRRGSAPRALVRFAARLWAGSLLGLLACCASAGCTILHAKRVLPPYALQPEGASFLGDPHTGKAQKVQVGLDVAHASAARLAEQPVNSAVQITMRSIERLSVHAVELMPLAKFACACPRLAQFRACRAPDPCDPGGGFGGPPTPARLTLLNDSEAALQGLLGLIARAQKRIDLMMYGWQDDPTGRQVAAALAARARDGILVRLLVDRASIVLHNEAVALGQHTFFDDLAATPNVHFIEAPDPFARFDHRKLAIADGRIAWSGGMILTESARKRWQNTAFLAEGPIVFQYANIFERRWRDVGGCPAFVPDPSSLAFAVAPNATVRMIETDIGARSLKNTLYYAVDHAQDHIYLVNPYFSDERLTAKLIAARARGVDVRAVLTLRGNLRPLVRFSNLTANNLFRGGVRVYLYPAMTHVKAMSIDGTWCYIGTGNFDELSLRNNREVALAVSSAEITQALDRELFLRDMAASEELHALLPPPKNLLKLELLSVWY